ncbi:MAG: arsenate reductase (glutaredoxin) [Gammaproteobacteria bacterium]|nr:arsenate reductase (glutaredoxin) [Gammaproteobacteria bacterium]
MEKFIIYHNPNCSKSRATLALLEENDIPVELVFYLETPLDVKQLKTLLKKLGMGVKDILRRSEPEYEELGLDDGSLAEEIVLDILSNHPKLLQRPIVVSGDRAIIGRPPENVLSLIEA